MIVLTRFFSEKVETMEKEWFRNLTEEQKEKLDLPDDLLEAVSGGEICRSHVPIFCGVLGKH